MRDRNPCPVWLMTDERMGNALLSALRHLPPGAGVVFRHRETPRKERHALWLAVRRIATARRLFVVSVGALPGTRGHHGGRTPTTAPAHDRRQAIANRAAAYLFVSPVFPTRSHSDANAIGPMKAARIANGLGSRVVALGGMDAHRFCRIAHLEFNSWAAIDSLNPATRQKRKAVPT